MPTVQKPASTFDTDAIVAEINGKIDALYPESLTPEKMDEFFCGVAVRLSKRNVKQKTGGPFGAVIVEYEGGLDENGRGIGKPQVIGIGTNHVVPNNDPSAHAEMTAYRDAAKRRGYSDLKGAVLYTSCECCPMCLACANGSGIDRIVYVNNRDQAKDIGFSDKLQYDMLHLPHDQLMTPVSRFGDNKKKDYRNKLGDHGAVVLDAEEKIYAVGDADTANDPTRVASLVALQNACAKAGNFCLPEGFRLVTRDRPHMAGLVVADWARMLRPRGAKDDPSQDGQTINPLKIVHFSNAYEQIEVKDKEGKSQVRQDSALTYAQPSLPDDKRAVRTERLPGGHVLDSRGPEVFGAWAADNSKTRY